MKEVSSMIKKFLMLLAVVGSVLASGCFENGTMLLLNKDGSGKIIARNYINDAGGLGALGGLGAALGAEAGEEVEMPDIAAGIKEAMENAAGSFGEGVELVSIKAVNNKLGWKGYEGVYSFPDVTKIKFKAVENALGDADGGVATEFNNSDMSYTIKFTPGDTSTLELLAELPDEEAGGDGADEVDAADMNNPQMMAMMAPMFAGMRMSYMIKVNGDITDTNARYVNKSNSSILVADIQMDKLLQNQEAMQALMAGGGKNPDFEKLDQMDIPGLKMQNPTKALKISFK